MYKFSPILVQFTFFFCLIYVAGFLPILTIYDTSMHYALHVPDAPALLVELINGMRLNKSL